MFKDNKGKVNKKQRKELKMADAKKFTKKQAKELFDAGYIDQAGYDKMFADGKVSTGARVTKGTVRGLYNTLDVFVSPQLYFKGNKGGQSNYTVEMKELHGKVEVLFNKYCEEISVEAESQEDAEDTGI